MNKNGLVAEEEFSRNCISKEISYMRDQRSQFVEDLDQYLVTSQKLLSDYTAIFVRIRYLGPTFANEFGESHDRVTKYITQFMNETRLRKEAIKEKNIRDKLENDLILKNEAQDRMLNEKFAL